jgi:hypothetical protein
MHLAAPIDSIDANDFIDTLLLFLLLSKGNKSVINASYSAYHP